jgi:hypothetical protein
MITIKYNTAVCTPAGWRSEVITAVAEYMSEKRARVIEVLDVGGNGNVGYGSRTGAKRQVYHVGGIAQRELGAVKNLSGVKIIEWDIHEQEA